jgi:hypothetical protein
MTKGGSETFVTRLVHVSQGGVRVAAVNRSLVPSVGCSFRVGGGLNYFSFALRNSTPHATHRINGLVQTGERARDSIVALHSGSVFK